MKILLTNDDGYQAEGLNILSEILSEEHTTYSVAPLRQMSGTGHSFHLRTPMELIKTGPRSYALDGSPADCVKSAVFGLFPDMNFDMVISGINDGPNLGSDMYYSGTVAGAREGMINGIFSLALSIDSWDVHKDYAARALFIRDFLGSLLEKSSIEETAFLNINFPSSEIPKGIRVTFPGRRVYKDYLQYQDENDKKFVILDGENPTYISTPGSDLDCVQDGFISVTPISDICNYQDIIMKFSYLNRDFYHA